MPSVIAETQYQGLAASVFGPMMKHFSIKECHEYGVIMPFA
jgi:hypothetical protein